MLFEAFIMSECFTWLNWVLWPLGLILCALALWLRTKHAKGVLAELAETTLAGHVLGTMRWLFVGEALVLRKVQRTA